MPAHNCALLCQHNWQFLAGMPMNTPFQTDATDQTLERQIPVEND
jgi:hypothetical protein